MLDASVAEFVGYTCSGMAGCISLDSQSPAVTIVPGFRPSSSLVHVLVASRMHGKHPGMLFWSEWTSREATLDAVLTFSRTRSP